MSILFIDVKPSFPNKFSVKAAWRGTQLVSRESIVLRGLYRCLTQIPFIEPAHLPHLSPSLEKWSSDKRGHMRNCTFLSLLGLQKASPLASGWTQVYTTHRAAEFSMGSGKARLQTRPHPCSTPFLSSNCFPHFLSWEHTPNTQPRAC